MPDAGCFEIRDQCPARRNNDRAVLLFEKVFGEVDGSPLNASGPQFWNNLKNIHDGLSYLLILIRETFSGKTRRVRRRKKRCVVRGGCAS